MATVYDAIVIGSGFGGAVVSCRLAERGMKVLVLERGRRWDPKDYPRNPGDAWVYDHEHPERHNGWVDLRFMDDMVVAQGAGIGGGSLIYANVSVEARPYLFKQGWPPEISYEVLKPYYDRVGKMLNVQSLPHSQLTSRYQLMKRAADKLGYQSRFIDLPLAVTFDPDWNHALDDPYNDKHSKSHLNDQGVQQGTCVHCGNCDLGCQVKAKNTLDLNYIPQAEKYHAEYRPLHMVRHISTDGGTYEVHFDRLQNGTRVPGSEKAKRVILAAGSLGSTELLLRSRDQYRSLPAVSQWLGQNWSSNGDFLTPAVHEHTDIAPTKGPTITCALDFLDETQKEQFFIEDGGIVDVVGNYLEERFHYSGRNKQVKILLNAISAIVRARDPLKHTMPWFAQGIDAADGRLYLGRKWYAPWKRTLKLDWDITRSESVIEAIIAMHKRLAEASGGKCTVPPTWTFLKNLITPHPLGGCKMSTSAATGVVDHRGQVFGYQSLYVADGAVIPEAVGLNPSRTIAALAERIAEGIQ